MAGDWIKMRMDLPEDPAVFKLTRLTGLDRYSVVGRLYAFWAWADKHAVDGRVDHATSTDVDDVVKHDGFAAAMVQVRWLEIGLDYLGIPKHDRHNGESAKERTLKNARQARWRAGQADAVGATPSTQATTAASTREEKRREEEKEGGGDKPARTRAAPIARPDDVTEQTWGDWLHLRKTKRAPVSETVIAGARGEADKAGMPFERFLQIWCRRGSQGLEAAWLRADERRPASDDWRTEQRTRTQQAAPGVAAGAPAAQFFIDAEAREVAPVLIGSST